MIIKDAMVIIHLAKITLLEKSCNYFKKVAIPDKVYEEIIAGKEKGYSEVIIIDNLIKMKKIEVKKTNNKLYIKKLNEFNIHGGEAEAVALYLEEKAEYLASDDDNLRRKREMLNINIIGTPAIIIKLFKEKNIEKDKFLESVRKLKEIGWFSNSVIDKMLMDIK